MWRLYTLFKHRNCYYYCVTAVTIAITVAVTSTAAMNWGMCRAVSGDWLPLLPPLLLATRSAGCSDYSSRHAYAAQGTAAEHQNDLPGEPASPDPDCEGGVGQGGVLTQAGAWGRDCAAEGQGHV